MTKKNYTFNPTQLLLISFLIVILIGTFLLMLPISTKNKEITPFINALFTSTTATCVTGLVVVPTATYWSIFGQVIILCLIQIGGLGVITAIAGISVFLQKKFGIQKGILIQETLNLNTQAGLKIFLKKMIIGTFTIEFLGAFCYAFVFVKEFGLKGIWVSIFTSVSAFCNAGIDIIADNSLCNYVTNPIINITTCILIVLGGIGYVVWWDVLHLIKNKKCKFQNLTLHSKIVIVTTVILILVGTIITFCVEYDNPLTIGNLSFGNKLQASIFQSITTRTAGFATLPQENFKITSAFFYLLLMFIGGSPIGTAGGIKTITLIVLIMSVLSTIKSNKDVNIYHRKINDETIQKCVAVICISFLTIFVSTFCLSLCTNTNILDILYETVSATATVGLSRNLTTSLNTLGKTIIIITMYLGRVGPISLVIAFSTKKNRNNITNPTEEISVG